MHFSQRVSMHLSWYLINSVWKIRQKNIRCSFNISLGKTGPSLIPKYCPVMISSVWLQKIDIGVWILLPISSLRMIDLTLGFLWLLRSITSKFAKWEAYFCKYHCRALNLLCSMFLFCPCQQPYWATCQVLCCETYACFSTVQTEVFKKRGGYS